MYERSRRDSPKTNFLPPMSKETGASSEFRRHNRSSWNLGSAEEKAERMKSYQPVTTKKIIPSEFKERIQTHNVFIAREEDDHKDKVEMRRNSKKRITRIKKNEKANKIKQLMQNHQKKFIQAEQDKLKHKNKGTMLISELWDERYYKKVLQTARLVHMHDEIEKNFRLGGMSPTSSSHEFEPGNRRRSNASSCSSDHSRASKDSTVLKYRLDFVVDDNKTQPIAREKSYKSAVPLRVIMKDSIISNNGSTSARILHREEVSLPLIKTPYTPSKNNGYNLALSRGSTDNHLYDRLVKESYDFAKMGSPRHMNIERSYLSQDRSYTGERTAELIKASESLDFIRGELSSLLEEQSARRSFKEVKKAYRNVETVGTNKSPRKNKNRPIVSRNNDHLTDILRERLKVSRNYELTANRISTESPEGKKTALIHKRI